MTAAAIAPLMSPISRMVRSIAPIASIERMVACCMPAICARMSSVALAVWPDERLDLARDDREAAAGVAGARRLDGGVERQQIGLLGDVGDELDDVADAPGGLVELLDGGVGPLGLADRLGGDGVRLRDLTIDLGHRGGQFVGRGRDVANVLRRFRGCRGGAAGPARRGVGGCRQLPRRGQHLVGDAAELGQRRFHVGAERDDFGRHLLLAAGARLGVVDHRMAEFLVLAHRVLKHRDRSRQRADLVAALAVGNVHARGAGRDLFRHPGDPLQRLRDRAPDDRHADAGEQDRARRDEAEEPGGRFDALVDVRIGALRRDASRSGRTARGACRSRRARLWLAPLSPHSRAAAGPSANARRTSSRRNSWYSLMRSANASNCAASSGCTTHCHSVTTSPIRSLARISPAAKVLAPAVSAAV